MLKKIRDYFGLVKEKDISVTYLRTFDATDNIDLKIEYLKSLETQETTRQTIIESKTSQLIGQTGIIFTLLSLFISNYFSKFSSLPQILQISLICLFVFSLSFYILTIYQATKYLNVRKYVYGQRSVSTVLKKFAKEEDFKIEEIKDIIYSIERNTLVNTQKANNLIYANRSFRTGTFSVALLSVFLIFSSYYSTSTPQSNRSIDNRTLTPIVDTNARTTDTLIKSKSKPTKNDTLKSST